MNMPRIMLKNILSLSLSDIVTRVLGIVVITYLARSLEPQGFGVLSFAMSIVNYFAFFVEPGIAIDSARSVAKNPQETGSKINSILGVKLVLSGLSFTVLLAMVLMMGRPLEAKLVIIIYGLLLFTQILPLGWAYQGLQKLEYLALYNIVQAVVYMLAIFLFIRNINDTVFVPVSQVLASAAAGILLFIPLITWYGKPRPSLDFTALVSIIKRTLPIGISTFLVCGINWNISTSILGFLCAPYDVGYFSAAFRLILVVIGVVMMFQATLFPVLSHYHVHSQKAMMRMIHFSEKLFTVAGIPIVIASIAAAKPLIPLIFGKEYLQSIFVFQILMAGTVLYAFNILYFSVLMAAEREKKNLAIAAARAVVLCVLSFAFISHKGIIGAAFAYTLSELIALGIYYFSAHEFIRPRILEFLPKPLIAAAAMILVLLSPLKSNVFISIPAAFLCYTAALFLVKGIRKSEILMFTQLLSRK